MLPVVADVAARWASRMWEAMPASVGVEMNSASVGFWLRVEGLEARGVATPVGAPATGVAAAASAKNSVLRSMTSVLLSLAPEPARTRAAPP